VAKGAEGSAFIKSLAKATSADVAASSDTTGAASLGGDWKLEKSNGVIESKAFASADYAHTFAAPAGTVIYNAANGHYYGIVSSTGTFDHAVTDVLTHSTAEWTAHLLTINNATEQNFVTTNFPKATGSGGLGFASQYVSWIGGKQVSAGNNQWITNEPFSYTNFATSEPGTGDYGFVLRGSDFQWTAEPSGSTYAEYLVEYESPNISKTIAQTFPEGTSSALASKTNYDGMSGLSQLTVEMWVKTSDTYGGLLSWAASGSGNDFLFYLTTATTFDIWVGNEKYEVDV